MKHTLDAIFENGVFRPLESPTIDDGETVRLTFETNGDGESDEPILRLAGLLSGAPVSSQDIDRELYGEG